MNLCFTKRKLSLLYAICALSHSCVLVSYADCAISALIVPHQSSIGFSCAKLILGQILGRSYHSRFWRGKSFLLKIFDRPEDFFAENRLDTSAFSFKVGRQKTWFWNNLRNLFFGRLSVVRWWKNWLIMLADVRHTCLLIKTRWRELRILPHAHSIEVNTLFTRHRVIFSLSKNSRICWLRGNAVWFTH